MKCLLLSDSLLCMRAYKRYNLPKGMRVVQTCTIQSMSTIDEKKQIPADNSFTSLKRALFDKYYSFLNDRQREAVFSVKGPLLVLAGAGSGKTTVLVNRISHIIAFGNAYEDETVPPGGQAYLPHMKDLLETGTREEIGEFLRATAVSPAKPWNVLCITFTNKAAGEFRQRLEAMLGTDASEIWAGTFHSVCVRILRKNIHHIGYDNSFAIYDTDDSKRLITQIMKELNIDTDNLPVKSVIGAISRAKENRVLPEEFFALIKKNDVREKHIAEIYSEYMKQLKKLSALDFDDIILCTTILFEEFPDILESYRKKFDYILVDEYQDTNPLQNQLIESLANRERNVCVVGDDDQSIYSFRGATVKNILEFDKAFPDAKTVKLEQNYRSTGNILAAANAVIANNEGRKGKELWTESDDGEKLHIREVYSQNEEAAYIADSILEKVSFGEKLSSFAVLYRTNAQSAAIESAFTKARIPYRVFGGIRFYERKEVKDLVAYLSLISNRADDMRLRRIINVPKRAIGTATVDAVAQLAESEGVPMFEIIAHAAEYPALRQAVSKLERFYALIAELSDFAADNTLSALVRQVVAKTEYMDMLLSSPEDKDKTEIVEEFVSSALLFEESSPEPTLAAFLEDIALVSDIDGYDENTDAVSLMTVHSAKGLEFPYVFLPGFEDGLFPSSRSLDSRDTEEEERRLAYVAITRAKKELTVIYTKSRVIYGRTEFCTPSRFLKEIPDDLCETESAVRRRRNDFVKAERPAPDTSRRVLATVEEAPRSSTGIPAGSNVVHPVFGKGVVVSSQDMGNDTLLEVEFFSGQVKKLMQNYARLKLI